MGAGINVGWIVEEIMKIYCIRVELLHRQSAIEYRNYFGLDKESSADIYSSISDQAEASIKLSSIKSLNKIISLPQQPKPHILRQPQFKTPHLDG